MDLGIVSLLCFTGVALAVTAVLLLARDLTGVLDARPPQASTLRLPRMPLARDEPAGQSFLGEFDRWLLRLVQDAGLAWPPLTTALVLLLVGLTVGGVLFIATDLPPAGLLGAGGGVAATLAILTVVRARRLRQLQDQLPPALEMLARAVRAGESLEQAVELVGQKSPEPLATEFRRVGRQLGMGLSMTAAMRGLVYRVRLIDVRIFTTTLAVHRRTGGNLASTLERLAAVIRDRLTYRRQVRAVTGAGRASATLIASVGPILFVFLFTVYPDYMRGLLIDHIGRSLLVIAVLLEAIGLIWISRLLRID